MNTVNVPVIKTDEDLRKALERLDQVFMAEAETPEADEREMLALIVESYERRKFPIEAPDPITAIHFAIEQRGYSSAFVAKVLGGPPRLSEILNGRRNLSLTQIHALHAQLEIPYDSLMSAPTKTAVSGDGPRKAAG